MINRREAPEPEMVRAEFESDTHWIYVLKEQYHGVYGGVGKVSVRKGDGDGGRPGDGRS